MRDYLYRARNDSGESFAGEVAAENIHAAAASIRDKGLWIVFLEEKLPTRSKFEVVKGWLTKEIELPGMGLGKREEALFLRQLAAFLQAGLTIQQALRGMEQYGEKKAYQSLKCQVMQDVSRGVSLSEALGRYPQVFSQTVCSCIRAGEASGTLEEILEQLSSHLEKSLRAREKLKSALVYPVILMAMMLAALFIVAIYILPTFAHLLSNINGELPWNTLLLLHLAEFLGSVQGKLLLVGGAGGALLVVFALLRSPGCRLWIDRQILALPKLGSLITHVEWMRILGTLSVLFKSGIRLAEALQLVALVPDNTYLGDCLKRIQRKVEQGQSLTDSLSLCKVVPWHTRELLAVGEQAGNLEAMLMQSASLCQEKAGHESERLLILVEPALTLLLGVVLLFLVMAIIMPILNVMDVLV